MARGMCMCNASIVMHDLVETGRGEDGGERHKLVEVYFKGRGSAPSVTATGDPAEVGEVE